MHAADRIRCSRCGANNFPGAPACFQCGAALSGSAPTAPARISQPLPRAPVSWLNQAPARRPSPLAYAAVAALTFLLALAVVLLVRRSGTPAPAAGTLSPPAASAPTAAPALTMDPLQAAAQQAISNGKRGLGEEAPPVSPDGRIHLQNGGSISQDEYNAAKSRMEQSPLYPGF